MTSSAAFSQPIRLQPEFPHAVSLALLTLLQAVAGALIEAADLVHGPTAGLLLLAELILIASLWRCWRLNRDPVCLFIDAAGQARLVRPAEGRAGLVRLPGGLSRRVGSWLFLVLQDSAGAWRLWLFRRSQTGSRRWRALLTHLSLRCD